MRPVTQEVFVAPHSFFLWFQHMIINNECWRRVEKRVSGFSSEQVAFPVRRIMLRMRDRP